jgi:salicylate 1-O-methyltransferase
VAFRGRELCPEGRLVVLTTAVGKDGEVGYRALLNTLIAALDDLAYRGLVRPNELRRMVIPMFARSEEDFRAPFAPSGRFENLVIEHLEVFDAQDRFWERFQSDRDSDAFGAQWAEFARRALFSTLAGALDGGAADPRAAEFVAQLEGTVATRLASAPQPMRIPLAAIVLAKRERLR